MANDAISNLKLLGYRLIELSNGEILAKRPDGELVLFNKSLEVLYSRFNSLCKIAKGVYVADNGKSITLVNETWGNVDVDRSRGVYSYIGNHYICEDTISMKVTVYNANGMKVIELKKYISVSKVAKDNKIVICAYNTKISYKYKIVTIDITTGNCEIYDTDIETMIDKDISLSNMKYCGDNKILMSSEDCMYMYDICTKENREIKGLSCTGYLKTVSNLIQVTYAYQEPYVIVRNTQTNRYYLMDEKETLVAIDTDMKPLVYYNGYYLVEVDKTIFILDKTCNVISKGYEHVEFISDNRVVTIYKGSVSILNIQTMEEKVIATGASYYRVYIESDEIYIAYDNTDDDLFVSLNGDMLYTLNELNVLMWLD